MLEELRRLQKLQGDLKLLKAETVRAGVAQTETEVSSVVEERKDAVVAMATLQPTNWGAVAEYKAETGEWDAVTHSMYPLYSSGTADNNLSLE